MDEEAHAPAGSAGWHCRHRGVWLLFGVAVDAEIMTTIATLCTGFDGIGVGARAAGLELAWGIEYEAAIAEVANANLGKHVTVANLLDCDPFDFEATDVLHASPPCTNASVANANGGETALDIAVARKIAEFVTVLKPRIFTLENVWQYRNFKSWLAIEDALHAAGYWVSVEHCNFADLGVPQTRKRMIVRAVRGGFVPYLPEPQPWIGWYAAIEDLIDTLPPSKFADWQLARLPELQRSFLVNESSTMEMRAADEPSAAQVASPRNMAQKAWLVAGGNAGNGMTARYGESPTFTITTGGLVKHPVRALFDCGRVVAMTPRALARFQSFPDDYVFSGNNRLDAKGIGNAVPPLAYQRIIEGLV